MKSTSAVTRRVLSVAEGYTACSTVGGAECVGSTSTNLPARSA